MPENGSYDDEYRCSNCGHMIGAVCAECGREMLCGEISNIVRSCPQVGCIERVLLEPERDLHGPVENPRYQEV